MNRTLLCALTVLAAAAIARIVSVVEPAGLNIQSARLPRRLN